MMGESERPGTKRKSPVLLAVLLARQQLCSQESSSEEKESRRSLGCSHSYLPSREKQAPDTHYPSRSRAGEALVLEPGSSYSVSLSPPLFFAISLAISLSLSRELLCVLISLCFHSLSMFISISLPPCFPPCFPLSLLSSFPQTLASICPSLSPSNDLSSLRLDLLSACPTWRRNGDVCRLMRSACVFLVCRGTQALTAARVWRAGRV